MASELTGPELDLLPEGTTVADKDGTVWVAVDEVRRYTTPTLADPYCRDTYTRRRWENPDRPLGPKQSNNMLEAKFGPIYFA